MDNSKIKTHAHSLAIDTCATEILLSVFCFFSGKQSKNNVNFNTVNLLGNIPYSDHGNCN